jgi:EAL domain-containing protein (putative c-di-GMP-specific phosphodiesterase class I)
MDSVRDRTRSNGVETFHVQPIVDLATGEICGGEVLWRPDGAPPSPEHLAALDEDPSVNVRVTQDSFVYALNLLDRIETDHWLSVNLSSRYIGSGRMFFRPISRALPDLDALRRRVGKRLVIEVTEKAIAGKQETNFLNELAGLHTIAIDDFGTGNAPLSHMLALHFAKVKVDRSVISGIDADTFRQRFLQWLVTGCHAIGVNVCAEGVETNSELAYLRRIGVNQGQGWLWSKAVDAERFESLIERPSPPTSLLCRALAQSGM